MATPSASSDSNAGGAILRVFAQRSAAALFVTELAAELGPRAAELGPGLERLAREGAIVISEHGAPDPHLEGADLRIVAPVGAQASRAEAEAAAADAAERLWSGWLGSFLATHRCM
jgi:hypothetical protein